jgi:hypothetical protein
MRIRIQFVFDINKINDYFACYNNIDLTKEMKSNIFRKILIVLIIIAPVIFDIGCKKQKRCGCGKDVVMEITDGQVYVSYLESSKTIMFQSIVSSGSTYYICNPGDWIDFVKKFPQGQLLLVSGKAYYDCQYMMNSSNYGYYIPPTYQVQVSNLREDKYSK